MAMSGSLTGARSLYFRPDRGNPSANLVLPRPACDRFRGEGWGEGFCFRLCSATLVSGNGSPSPGTRAEARLPTPRKRGEVDEAAVTGSQPKHDGSIMRSEASMTEQG